MPRFRKRPHSDPRKPLAFPAVRGQIARHENRERDFDYYLLLTLVGGAVFFTLFDPGYPEEPAASVSHAWGSLWPRT